MSVISNSSVGGSEACVYVMVYPGCIPPPHLSLPEHTTLTYITPPTPRSVTELCWSLTSRLCSCSLQYHTDAAVLRGTEKIKHSQNWIFHHRSCHVMRSKHSELGAAWIQTIRKNGISTSKWATTHIQSLSCTHLPQFGVLSWGASTTATVKVTSKVKLQQVVLGQHLLPTHSVGSQYSKLHTIQVHAAGTVVVHYWVSSCGPCFLNRHESLLAFTFIHSCADCIYIKFLKCHCVPALWSFSHCLTD